MIAQHSDSASLDTPKIMSSASYASIHHSYLANYLANSISLLRKHNLFCDALLARSGGKLDGSNWRRMGRTEQEWVAEALTCAGNIPSVTVANVCDALYDAGLGDLATRVAAYASGVPFAVVSASNFAPLGHSNYQPSQATAPSAKGRRTLVLKKKQPLPNFLIVAHEDAEHVVVTTEIIETKTVAMEYLNAAAKDPTASKIPHGAYALIGTGSRTDGDVAMLEAGIAEVEDDEEVEPAEGPAIKLSNTVPAAAATKSGTVLKYGSRKIASKPTDPLHAVIIIGRNTDGEYLVMTPEDDQPRFTPSSAAKILAEQVLPEFPDDEFGIYANMSKTKTKITKGSVQKVTGLKISSK